MSLEACPHCHEQVHKTEDGCGTEKCMARRAFIRQAAIAYLATCPFDRGISATDAEVFEECWRDAVELWNAKPEGC